jgi:ribosomal protein S18 acetylase RimI-like enzyme
LGFETVGQRPNYYRVQEGREDAILMAVNLEAMSNS